MSPDLAATIYRHTARHLADTWRQAHPGDTPGELVPGEDDITDQPRAAQIAAWQRQHAAAHGSRLDETGECVACLGDDDAGYKRRADV